MSDIEIINLSVPETDCAICGLRCFLEQGLPMYEDVVVSDDYDGKWGGMPVCHECYVKHRPEDEEGAGDE